MKTIKRIIVVVLAISVISSFNIITVSADSEIQETGLSVYGEESLENLTPEMQLQQLNANKNISADKKAQATEKLEFMMLTEAERTNVVQSTMARSLCAIKTCNVPFYRQEKVIGVDRQPLSRLCATCPKEPIIQRKHRLPDILKPLQLVPLQPIWQIG